MRRGTLVALLLALGIAQAAAGQEVDDKRKPPKPKPDCLDGSVYDDRKFESGLTSSLFNDNFVMLVEAPSYPARLNKVCIAWRRTSFFWTVFFDIRVWAADGPNGGPGTLLGTMGPFVANKVPPKAKFYTYDVAWQGLVIDGPVYVGPYWDPIDALAIYLAMDTGPRTQRRRAFHNVGIFGDLPPSTEIGVSFDQAPNYRAFGIRAVFGPP
jgi:hypothetical protein